MIKKESTNHHPNKLKLTKKILSVEVPTLLKENRNERRVGRVLAVQALYAYESHQLGGDQINIDELCRFDWAKNKKAGSISFAIELVKGTINFIDKIDEIIKPRLVGWEFDRISLINKSILRLSIYQIMYLNDVPGVVVINEAVDLAKLFSENEDYKFINALLDKVQATCKV